MRGMLEMTMGSRKTVPLRMLRIVPLGDFHIFFNLNSVPATKEREKAHARDRQRTDKRNMRGKKVRYIHTYQVCASYSNKKTREKKTMNREKARDWFVLVD